ncbi:MAG: PP2C family protein-serine/threonine phosphatase [Candidatus Xenobia bacterium]
MLRLRPEDGRSYDVAAATDIGRREVNQDRHAIEELGDGTWFVAVADGLGGQQAGEVASETATKLLCEKARRWKKTLRPEALADAMDKSLREVHAAICKQGRRDCERQGMATTIVCAVLRPDGVVQRYAGDSALFWSRQERLLYRSAPHLLDERITSCLGGPNRLLLSPQRAHEYDWFLRVKAGDTLVLCSDGLLHSLAEPTLLGMFAQEGAAEALADRLVRAALKAGERDNVTALAIRVA